MLTPILRLLTVQVCVLAGIVLPFTSLPLRAFPLALVLWFVLGLGIGLLIGRWYAFFLAAVPVVQLVLVPLIVARATGQPFLRGENFELIVHVISWTWATGIGIGLGLRWARRHGVV